MLVSRQITRPIATQLGFNLIELVIVIVVSGVLAVVVAPIVMKPFQAYDDTSRRVALVDAAESAMRQIARDVRDAIPNTVRTNGKVLELMPIQGGGRYRSNEIVLGDNSSLTPSALDNQFLMLGNASTLPSGARIVVYNTGSSQFYSAATSGGLGIITPTSTTISVTDTGNEDTFDLSSAFQFDLTGNGSPGKRFYIATSPVTYHCDETLGTILRFEGYSTAVAQPVNRNASPLTGATDTGLLVDNVSVCNFSYSAGSNTRAGLLIMSISLTIDGESINLLHQVHTGNAP
jgi:MSHA biogenesis protein MshO